MDTLASDLSSIVGDNVEWDYSSLGGYMPQKASIIVSPIFNSPFQSDFTESEKFIAIQNYTTGFQKSDSLSRTSQGYVIENTGLGDVKAIYNNDDQVLMEYPMYLNDEVVDNYLGSLSFEYNGTPQNNSCFGVSRAKVDGRGTFIFPGGITVENVLRYSVIDSTTTTVQVLGEVLLVRRQYEYYDLANDTLPIFIHAHAEVQSGFPNPLINLTQVMSKHPQWFKRSYLNRSWRLTCTLIQVKASFK